MQSVVACRVANLALLKPNFEIQAFWTQLAFFENPKYQPTKIWLFLFLFFSMKGLTLTKHCLSYIFITNIFWQESMTIAGCKEYCKDFTVALKVFDVFNTKQQYNSVFTGKENASKNWNCILSMFLTSFNIYFCLVMHVLCVAHVSELLTGLFWLFWDKIRLFWWIWSLVVDS